MLHFKLCQMRNLHRAYITCKVTNHPHKLSRGALVEADGVAGNGLRGGHCGKTKGKGEGN